MQHTHVRLCRSAQVMYQELHERKSNKFIMLTHINSIHGEQLMIIIREVVDMHF